MMVATRLVVLVSILGITADVTAAPSAPPPYILREIRSFHTARSRGRRTPAPIPREAVVKLMNVWAQTGAPCPR
jgi:hypothetical protein